MSDAAKRDVKARSEAETAWRINESDADKRREMLLFRDRLSSNLDDVLEVGCGRGRLTEVLASQCDRLIATDVASEMVTHTRDRLPEHDTVSVAIADAECLPFAANSVDAVCASQVVGHLPELETFLTDVARVLRPGGQLLLSTGNLCNPFNALYQYKTLLDPQREMTLSGFTEAVREGRTRTYWLTRQGHQRDTLRVLSRFVAATPFELVWSSGTTVIPPESVVTDWLPNIVFSAGGTVREQLPDETSDDLLSWFARTILLDLRYDVSE